MNVFNTYVYENRSMSNDLSRPLMLENLNVDNMQIHIPKEIDGTDMGTWAWWLVYQNVKREKCSIPMTLEGVTNDEGEEEYISTVGLNHGFTGKHGTVMYAIEAVQADGSGAVTHEWHTRTYKLEIVHTLQGNQTEYSETESDIISALISRVNELITSGAEIAEIAETIEHAAETAQEVIDSIPADYSELSDQVGTNTAAIALKADKATTYTKTEVDQMIEDVTVETDTTLEVSGAPADAAETGRQLGLINESLDAISLGIDDGDGKVYIYVNGVKQGDGIEFSSAPAVYDVIVNAKGRVSTQSATTSVERGGSVTIAYTIPEGWILSASATIRGNPIEVPSGNPIMFTNITGPLEVNLNTRKPYSALTDMPSYYRAPVSDALSYIDALGNGWVNYIITTDHHIGLLNELHSADIVSYLLSTGKFDKSIILGDFVNGGYVDGENYSLALSIDWDGNNDKTLFVKGNHDTNLDADEVLDDFMSGVQNLVIDPTSRWWYYDNINDKIRFIGLQYGTTNYAFFEQAVRTLPTGWVYFVLNHIPLSSYPAGTAWTIDDTPIQNILARYTDKILAGFLAGHLHADSCVQFEWLAWHTIFNCDKTDNAKSEANRASGTVTEHAITLMSVNKGISKVKFYRIGSVLWKTRQNDSWVYTGGTPSQWEYTYVPLHFARSDGTEWADGLPYILEWTEGQRLSNMNDGATENNSTWSISDFVYCEGANCITVNSTAYIERSCFYDANKTPLNINPTKTRGDGSLYIITVPTGAAYWRTSYPTGSCSIYEAIPYANAYAS